MANIIGLIRRAKRTMYDDCSRQLAVIASFRLAVYRFIVYIDAVEVSLSVYSVLEHIILQY
jgi:hypothetical protein